MVESAVSKREVFVVEDERIYLPSSDGNVYALQKSNAKVLWKFELDKGVPTQLVVTAWAAKQPRPINPSPATMTRRSVLGGKLLPTELATTPAQHRWLLRAADSRLPRPRFGRLLLK